MERSVGWDMEEGEAGDGQAFETVLDAESEMEAGTATGDSSLDCKAVIEAAIERAKNDCGAPFEPEVLHALLALQKSDLAEWMRVRARLKRASNDISPPQLDLALRKLAKELKDVAPTHHAYAVDVLSDLSIDSHHPVAAMGSIYVPNAASCLWSPLSLGELERIIAQKHDESPRVLRRLNTLRGLSHEEDEQVLA